ncbi:MAG TPA: hypothetical protein PLM29_02515 [Deltaproteobacteria bacterium]|nr:hypothetical protein [Deltaproteobacteria bacterium]
MKRLPFLLVILMLCSCSTRQISDRYSGATEQRLTSHSVNDLMEKLPGEHFSTIQGKKIAVTCHFLNNIEPVAYARERLEMELINTYNARIVSDEVDAELRLHVFFTAIGTDLDSFGIRIPELVVPGAGVLSAIDVIALEMFHGVTEVYYYFLDEQETIVLKGEPLKAIVRNDTLKLPIISIPINTVK